MSDVIADLRVALGAYCVLTGDAIPFRNWQDSSSVAGARPRALILPRSTEAVSAALRICHAAGQSVVPQGGLTGLAGGATPDAAEICLSLERMVGVEEVDVTASTLTALAGTTLTAIQQAAEDAGLLCGIDLGARGSCSIGGNVATNAGGNTVLRYGMARKQVLGLEVVLADGRIVRSLNKMLKNNAGYDWTQGFIGSEGTLGVITRVVLQLHPRPRGVETALVAVDTVEAAVMILRRAGRDLIGGLMAFEAMWANFLDVAVSRLGLTAPFAATPPITLLMETVTDGTAAGRAGLEAFLATAIDDGLASDALIAQSTSEAKRFWAYRESPYEYNRVAPARVGFDVSIPIARMTEAVARIRGGIAARWPDATHVYYGHIADSNLHSIVMAEHFTADDKAAIEATIYGIIAEVGGSISAEHGIGRAKRAYLGLSRTTAELDLMRTLKAALDPKGILNPGRIL